MGPSRRKGPSRPLWAAQGSRPTARAGVWAATSPRRRRSPNDGGRGGVAPRDLVARPERLRVRISATDNPRRLPAARWMVLGLAAATSAIVATVSPLLVPVYLLMLALILWIPTPTPGPAADVRVPAEVEPRSTPSAVIEPEPPPTPTTEQPTRKAKGRPRSKAKEAPTVEEPPPARWVRVGPGQFVRVEGGEGPSGPQVIELGPARPAAEVEVFPPTPSPDSPREGCGEGLDPAPRFDPIEDAIADPLPTSSPSHDWPGPEPPFVHEVDIAEADPRPDPLPGYQERGSEGTIEVEDGPDLDVEEREAQPEPPRRPRSLQVARLRSQAVRPRPAHPRPRRIQRPACRRAIQARPRRRAPTPRGPPSAPANVPSAGRLWAHLANLRRRPARTPPTTDPALSGREVPTPPAPVTDNHPSTHPHDPARRCSETRPDRPLGRLDGGRSGTSGRRPLAPDRATDRTLSARRVRPSRPSSRRADSARSRVDRGAAAGVAAFGGGCPATRAGGPGILGGVARRLKADRGEADA